MAAGIALCIAAFFFGLRQIFLSPSNKGWPPAPTFVRVALFGVMGGFLYRGVELVQSAPSTEPVSLSSALVSVSICFYSVVMWVNVARQNYPAEVWRRIERIMTLAQCKNATVLVELARQGVAVMMPGRRGDVEPIGPADISAPAGIPVPNGHGQKVLETLHLL